MRVSLVQLRAFDLCRSVDGAETSTVLKTIPQEIHTIYRIFFFEEEEEEEKEIR